VHTVRPVKGVMLQAMLLAGLVAAPLGSLALFVPIRRHARRAGTWPAIRRLVLAVLGTVVLAAAVVVTLRLLSASRHNLIAGAAAVVFASLVWIRGHPELRILVGDLRCARHRALAAPDHADHAAERP
jgi:drug/metabolite transporter (DMT)-like permease